MSERERLQIQAFHAERIENDPATSVRILEQIIEKYPRERDAYILLCRTYFISFYDVGNGTRVLLAGLKVDPMDKGMWNYLAYSYASLGRRSEALDAIDHYVKIAPGEPNPYDSRGDIYMLFGERDSALIWYRKAISIRSDFGSAQRLAYDAMDLLDYEGASKYFSQLHTPVDNSPFIAFHRGQFVKARKELEEDLSRHQLLGSHDHMAYDYLRLLLTEYELGDYSAMLEAAKHLSEELKHDPSDKTHGREALAWAYLKTGNIKSHQEMIQQLENIRDDRIPLDRIALAYLSALFEFERGNYPSAIAKYQEGFRVIGGIAVQPRKPERNGTRIQPVVQNVFDSTQAKPKECPGVKEHCAPVGEKQEGTDDQLAAEHDDPAGHADRAGCGR